MHRPRAGRPPAPLLTHHKDPPALPRRPGGNPVLSSGPRKTKSWRSSCCWRKLPRSTNWSLASNLGPGSGTWRGSVSTRGDAGRSWPRAGAHSPCWPVQRTCVHGSRAAPDLIAWTPLGDPTLGASSEVRLQGASQVPLCPVVTSCPASWSPVLGGQQNTPGQEHQAQVSVQGSATSSPPVGTQQALRGTGPAPSALVEGEYWETFPGVPREPRVRGHPFSPLPSVLFPKACLSTGGTMFIRYK